MVTRIPTAHRRLHHPFALLAAISVLSFAVACDKVPLLAPSGTVITLFPAASTVPLNGQVEIVATVIENGTTSPTTPGGGTTTPGGGTTTPGTTTSSSTGAGTPVQNGTLVSFTTTLGKIEPAEARTQNGQVRVKFIANGQSGLATITAFSGGASGKIENLKVGSAAAERVLLSASPQTLGPNGGTALISARVEDTSGLGVRGVPVTFTSDKGTLSASSVATNDEGVASTLLTTAQAAKVTANVAGKTADVTVGLDPRTGVTLAGPTQSVSAGVPVSFTVGVGSAANVRNVTVDFGDGTSQSLGAISGSTTVQHTYTESGTYTAQARATDASGFSEAVSTSVTVLPAQPPSVIVTPSNQRPSVNETVIVRAQVSGNTSSIIRYEWDFGTGANPQTATTTGNQASVSWSSVGTKVINVRAVQASGPSGDGFGTVTVTGTTTSTIIK